MRLLFAEDDRDLSAAVKTLLERNGYLVDAVYDGEEAVSWAEAENYDGMILDWMMPEKDGIRALQEMRKQGIRTPCMMLTEARYSMYLAAQWLAGTSLNFVPLGTTDSAALLPSII